MFGNRHCSRREFMKAAGLAAAGCAVCRGAVAATAADVPHEASYWDVVEGSTVRCLLCPWQCVVADGQRGKCEVRENRGGKYYSLVYGHPCAAHNDPIEKKPFFHVYPGSRAFSIATVGCNIECKFCQNWDIAQKRPEQAPTPFVTPDQIVEAAVAARSKTVAYTYSEPTIYYEYMRDVAKAAKAAGLANIVVSNGFIAEKPLKDLAPLLTAMKVDFKAFSTTFYEDVCGGQLEPVKETLKRLAGSGVWFEIVVLVIPTLNDDADETKRMAAWIVKELGPDVPLHFTRFHPNYKLRNLPPTPPETVIKARAIAMAEGVHYVYTGNMPGGEGDNTFCPKCKTMVLSRIGQTVLSDALAHGQCPKCGHPIPGVWADAAVEKAK